MPDPNLVAGESDAGRAWAGGSGHALTSWNDVVVFFGGVTARPLTPDSHDRDKARLGRPEQMPWEVLRVTETGHDPSPLDLSHRRLQPRSVLVAKLGHTMTAWQNVGKGGYPRSLRETRPATR